MKRQQNDLVRDYQRVYFFVGVKDMRTLIVKTKTLCLAVVFFSMSVASVSAQMSSVLMNNDLICANPTTIYPDVTLDESQTVDLQSVTRNIGGGVTADVDVLADKYGELGADSDVSVVDWVQVELRVVASDGTAADAAGLDRSAIPDATVRTAGLLLANGKVVDPTQDAGTAIVEGVTLGTQLPDESNVLDGSVYVVVSHRNHISIMSAQAHNDTIANEEELDFTASAANAYQGGVKEVTVAGATAYAMIAGDANADGQVQAIDGQNTVAPNSGRSGYHNGDLDMNQQVQAIDSQNTLAPNSGQGIQFNAVFNIDSRLTSLAPTAAAEVVCWQQAASS